MFARIAKRWLPVICLCILLLPSLSACTIKATEHPDQLTYRLPTTLTIAVGQTLPGTDIRYQRMSDKGAHVLIKGQEAIKRQGDSLDWRGQPLPGVDVDLQLRILWYNEQELRVVGTAKVVIKGVQPRPAVITTSAPMHYTGPVFYSLARGAVLPGSTLTYGAKTEEGVKLGGIEGYPFRQVGDSISWEGVLREDVYLRLDLRVLQFDERGLRVLGIVNLWLGH